MYGLKLTKNKVKKKKNDSMKYNRDGKYRQVNKCFLSLKNKREYLHLAFKSKSILFRKRLKITKVFF